MGYKVKVGIEIRNDSLKREGAFLRVKKKMRGEMDRVWKDFFEKNPDVKEEDVRRWVEKRLEANKIRRISTRLVKATVK